MKSSLTIGKIISCILIDYFIILTDKFMKIQLRISQKLWKGKFSILRFEQLQNI